MTLFKAPWCQLHRDERSFLGDVGRGWDDIKDAEYFGTGQKHRKGQCDLNSGVILKSETF